MYFLSIHSLITENKGREQRRERKDLPGGGGDDGGSDGEPRI